MKIRIEPEAEEDLRQFEKEHQEYIRDRLMELEDKPTSHEDSGNIRVKGRQVFKYVMKKDDKRGGRDYRAVYDIQDGEIKIIGIFHRDKGYDKEELGGRL